MMLGFADDAIMAKYLPAEPDLETIEETSHTWHIQNWSKLEKREEGPIFQCGGFPWCVLLCLSGTLANYKRDSLMFLPRRVLFFPFGNSVEHASFYLEHGFPENDQPQDWHACVQFALVLWKPNDPSTFVPHCMISPTRK